MTTRTLGRDCAVSVLLVTTALLAGCSEPSAPAKSGAGQIAVVRPVVDPAVLEKGKVLFGKHCASCHGDSAQGALNWQKAGPDGKYPPPPLNGSAHAWHHPTAALRSVIRNGTQRIGGNMPPWRDKLNDAEIDAIIAWFQSLWPDELYAAWSEMDRKASQ